MKGVVQRTGSIFIALFMAAGGSVTPAAAEETPESHDLLLLSNPPILKDSDNTMSIIEKSPVQYEKGRFTIRAYSSESSSGLQAPSQRETFKTEFYINVVNGKTIVPEVRITF